MSIRLRFYLFISAFLLTTLHAIGQENTQRQILEQAENYYQIGRIEQTIDILKDNIDIFQGNVRQSALRMLTICCLDLDREDEAQLYAKQLIKLNNYYNSANDPARFQDLISKLKEGIITTITTASSQSETINEAPAPITIITAEMIEELGYNRNLNQILAAYVPGIAEITPMQEGLNLSMHSAYAMEQELILIMENGHRLNTRLDNNGPTNYSISTEKIDHIEVLRGPASSLYGNVAVSAVVNIITKSGKSINGVKAKYGYGTFNTNKADLTMGTQFMDADIFVWASLYNSDGQLRHFNDGEGYLKNFDYSNEVEQFGTLKEVHANPDKIYVDAFKDTPSYDVGLTFQMKGFNLLFSRKNSKKVQSFTYYRGGYEYDKYFPIGGMMPGYGVESTHAEIGYAHQFKNIHLSGSVYSDWYNNSVYDVDEDSCMLYSIKVNSADEPILDEYGQMQYEDTTTRVGSFTYFQFREQNMGGTVKASTNYRLGKTKGNIMAGLQYEYFSYISRYELSSSNESYPRIGGGYLDKNVISDVDAESILSFFVQDKHYIMPQLILNAGCRYDIKDRNNQGIYRTFSPRLALMYVPSDRFSLKLSYSESFADPSFYLRQILRRESFTMDPQHLTAVQLTAMGNMPAMHLHYEVNLFHNKYTNLLCWEFRDVAPTSLWGKNAGQLRNIGIEAAVGYTHKRLAANISLYSSRDISSKYYYYNYSKDMVTGVPHFTLNLHGSYKLMQKQNHQIKIYGHASYTGRKLNFREEEELDYYVDGKLLFDLGIQYRFHQNLQLALDCENICNTDHYICGPNYQNSPHFQRTRTLMASISYQF